MEVTDILAIFFWVAWQQIETFTLNQFLSVYEALFALIQYNVSGIPGFCCKNKP